MGLCVGQVEGPRFGGNQADQTASDRKGRPVNGFGVQTFRCIELKHIVSPEDIGRTDLCHHVRRNKADNLVESFLGPDRFRHHFAQSAQKDTRSGQRPPQSRQMSLPGAASAQPAVQVLSNSYIEWRVRTASSVKAASIKIEIFISDVVIRRMFIPREARA